MSAPITQEPTSGINSGDLKTASHPSNARGGSTSVWCRATQPPQNGTSIAVTE
jgi:hypothetical protein